MDTPLLGIVLLERCNLLIIKYIYIIYNSIISKDGGTLKNN